MTVGRVEARAQIASFLAFPNVTGLNKVFTAFPKRINFEENAQPGQLSRAVAVIHIEQEAEKRIAIGGAHNGWKQVDYSIALQLFHHSVQRDAENAMADFDTLVDNIKNKLRSDHRLGDDTGVLIWQAAEQNINISYGEPLTTAGNAIETWATIRFTVTQMIQA